MYELSQGNHLEPLADALIQRLGAARKSPLQAPWVMVPHREMGQWLARRMASQLGICANVNFVQPSEAIWALLSSANPHITINNAFAPDCLTPRIFGLLSRLPEQADFAPLKRFLSTQSGSVKMAFASRLAGIFDQYLVFRPHWLMQWEASQEGDWQGWIWRQLTQDKPWHWARALQWLERTPGPDISALNIPALHVFAQSTLSPGFFMAIRRFSEQLPTHIYHWTPTEVYWLDVASPRSRKSVSQEAEPYVSQLLASMGQPLKDAADQLFEWAPNEQDYFVSSLPQTLLGAIQRDLLNFDLNSPNASRLADGSLKILRCTTRQREVEVCRDHLHQLFDNDPTLQPSQVLVICPDLAAYLPAIRAEFGPPGSGDRWPYRVLGGNAVRAFDAGSALLHALELLVAAPLDRRCLELLQYPAVQRRFRLDPDRLEDVTRWVTASGLFVDDHSGKFSWDAAFDRLVGAVTLDPGAIQTSTANPIHPAEASAIGALFDLLSALQGFSRNFSRPRTLTAWSSALSQLQNVLLDPHFTDIHYLSEITAPLAGVIPPEDVVMDVAALYGLLKQLRPAANAGGGGPGGVTVAAPAAVRLLPARIIYVLGVTDGEFPGPAMTSELNRMDSSPPRRGDRARRLEDRLLMLEWITSARQQLVLSGRSRHPVTAEPEALSSLLEELLAWCETHHAIAPDELAITPPLHGFSPAGDNRLESYAKHFSVTSSESNNAFVGPPIPLVKPKQLTLDELCRFWKSPARWFVEQVLGVWLDLPQGLTPMQPPVAVDPLLRFQLLDDALDLTPAVLQKKLAAEVALPDGQLGQALAHGMTAELANLRERERAARGDHRAITVDFERTINSLLLVGVLDQIHNGRRVVVTSSKLNDGRAMELWIRHLALCCLQPQATSLLIARDDSLALSAAPEPLATLATLVDYYLLGQSEPLRFYPAASRLAASEKNPQSRFDDSFEGGKSAHVELAFRGSDPLAGDFESLAKTLWLPMQGCVINEKF